MPYLAFNEHHTMRVLARLNKVPVAHTQLSDDGQLLLVERFTSLDDVAFTPVFDVVTTQAYDGFRDGAPGLSIEGRKTWNPGKTLAHFFSSRLGIAPRKYSQMVEELCESAVEVGRELTKLAVTETRWRSIIKNMLHAWDRGIQDARNPSSTVSLAPVIDTAGFSGYDKPPPAPRTGRSPLLAKRRSSPRVRKRKNESRPG